MNPTTTDPAQQYVWTAPHLTPEQGKALGERLMKYRRNRMRAEAAYYAERRHLRTGGAH